MQETVSLSVSPIQALLALAFQVWLVVFPIIIIKKLNHLISLFEDDGDGAQEQEEEDPSRDAE